MSFFWTYNRLADINGAINAGVYGITNNEAEKLLDYPRNLMARTYFKGNKNDDLSAINYEPRIATYSGMTVSAEAEIYEIEYRDDCAYLILKSEYEVPDGPTFTLFSEKIKIDFSTATDTEPAEEEPSGGCKSEAAGAGTAICVVAAAFAIYKLNKKAKRI